MENLSTQKTGPEQREFITEHGTRALTKEIEWGALTRAIMTYMAMAEVVPTSSDIIKSAAKILEDMQKLKV